MTGRVFRAYVEQCLAPALAPGDVVALDDLAAHKMAGVRQTLAAAGASLLYLPPYSPDLNPIEHLFAKLKALCARPPPGPKRNSGRPSAASAPPSRQPNAPAISTTAITVLLKVKVL